MKFTKRQKGILGIIFIVCLIILSWIGLSKLYPESNTFRYLPDRIYRIIKIAFGGDPSATSLEKEDIPWELIIVKIFCVGILIFGAFKIIQKVFSEQYQLFKASFKSNHYISIGLSKKGKQLMHNLKTDLKQTGVVIEKQLEHANIASARKEGHTIILGNAEENNTLIDAGIKKASNMIIFLDDEAAVIEILESVQDIYKKDKVKNNLKCFIHLKNPRLMDLVKNAGLQIHHTNIEIHLFNIHKMLARSFYSNLPKDFQEQGKQLKEIKRIIFIGFGEFAKALLIQTFRIFHVNSNDKLNIAIYCSNANHERYRFEEQYPMASHIFPYQFIEFDCSYNQLLHEQEIQINDPSSLFICADNKDEANLNQSLEILYKSANYTFPIYVLNAEGNGLKNIINQSDQRNRLKFFGNLEDTCTIEFITGEKQDKLAQTIHDDYKKLISGSSSESSKYTSDWDLLTEDAKDANRAQADHIALKLLIAKGNISLKPNSELKFSEDEIEDLAIIEHLRWMAHRYLNEWKYGDQRDDDLKLHPSLVSWKELSESEKQKDRDTILRIPLLLNQH